MGGDTVKEQCFTVMTLDRELSVRLLLTEQGVVMAITGGDLPHLGAVTIVPPEGEPYTEQFPGHRDGTVCGRWGTVLAERGLRPAVISCGIHYDGLTSDGLRLVLAGTDSLLAKSLDWLECNFL